MTGDLFPFTYIVTDGVLYLTYEDGDETDYEVSVNGNDMVLINTFYQEEQIFVRAGSDATPPTEAPDATEATAPTEAPEKYDPYAYLIDEIIGSWLDVDAGENEGFTFKKDLTGIYTWQTESDNFTYKITDNVLEFYFESGDYGSFLISIDGDTLYLQGWPLERQS